MAKLSIYHFIADAFNLNVRAQENRDSGLIRCEIVPQSANCSAPVRPAYQPVSLPYLTWVPVAFADWRPS